MNIYYVLTSTVCYSEKSIKSSITFCVTNAQKWGFCDRNLKILACYVLPIQSAFSKTMTKAHDGQICNCNILFFKYHMQGLIIKPTALCNKLTKWN